MRRAALIDSLVKLCYELGFDGVDYDWEHPRGEREELAYSLLIEKTAERFAEDRLLVTVAQAGWHCPAEKIALGITFYGRNAKRGAIVYAQLIHEREVAPDLDDLDGYAYNGPDTVAEKTRFALERSLAGVMVWELSMDAAGDRSLMSVIARIFEEHAAAAE